MICGKNLKIALTFKVNLRPKHDGKLLNTTTQLGLTHV